MKFLFLSLFLLLNFLQAKEYKAVFDCSSGDANFIKSRMWLVGKTVDMIEEQKNTVEFVITLHGSCVAMVSKDYDLIVPDEDVKIIKQAQTYLTSLVKEKDVKVIVCAMSLAANSIDKEDVLEFIHISKNSFVDTIRYQNEGYALMTFK